VLELEIPRAEFGQSVAYTGNAKTDNKTQDQAAPMQAQLRLGQGRERRVLKVVHI
jgi:hypothetical protein